MKFQFFVEFINFIGNFISNTSKCFCVPSKTLKNKKNLEFHEKKKGENRRQAKKKEKKRTWHPALNKSDSWIQVPQNKDQKR